jgi:hypothetical protein
MRRYSVWCEDWSFYLDELCEVRIGSCWTRRGMVRRVRKLNRNVPINATFRFYGQEGK